MGIEIMRVDDTGIYGFFGDYRWLSNFHVCKVVVNGKDFPSSEHAFMYGKLTEEDKNCSFFKAEKYENDTFQKMNLTNWYNEVITMSCKEVKAWGRTVNLRPDWESVKLKVMEDALHSKFTINADLKKKLLNTGDLYLEESNWWKDTYWGVCNGVGQNNLGKLLMKVRNEIKWI